MLIYAYHNTTTGPPVIIFISNSTVSMEGDKVNLLCTAINDVHTNHSLQINWYKGNDLIIPDSKHISLYNETVKNSRQLKSILTLDPVNPTDDGVYTCRAFNHPDLYSESKTNLSIECELTITAKFVAIQHVCTKYFPFIQMVHMFP